MSFPFNLSRLDRTGTTSTISLADPDFGLPGKIDLLGVDVFTEALLHGRRAGPSGTPVAVFGWVLAGPTSQLSPEACATSHHTLVATGDDLLRKFWEIEENEKMSLACHQKKGLSYGTLKRTIVVLLMGSLMFRCPKGLTLHFWVNHDLMQYEDFCALNVLCVPKANSKLLTLCLICSMRNLCPQRISKHPPAVCSISPCTLSKRS